MSAACSPLLSASALAHGGEQIEPNAGCWNAWVIASGGDFRAPPAPNNGAASTETNELKALAGRRDVEEMDLIAYRDVGPPPYRSREICLEETLRDVLPRQWAIHDFALMHAAIYDAMVAAWDSKYAYNRKAAERGRFQPRSGTSQSPQSVLSGGACSRGRRRGRRC